MPSETSVVEGVGKVLFIGGRWVPADGGKTFAVHDPATGEALCQIADASPADGVAALDAAVAAQDSWASHPPRERGEILRRAYQELTSRVDELALLMTLEMGKPLAEARGEIAYAAEFFRWFAEEAVRIDGGYATAPNGTGRFLVAKQPVGPSLLITPWNFPMAMGTRKIGPAIAAGCTSVIKPASQTPLCMLALARILADAGLPDGVLNVLTTTDSGGVMEPLIRDGRARKLSFTGSTAVGRKLLEQCSEKVLRTSMELGGNAPFLVFADADLDAAARAAVIAAFANSGQVCSAGTRLFVEQSVHREFAERVARIAQTLRIGDGMNPDTDLGPLVSARQLARVCGHMDDARTAGATAISGGARLGGAGYDQGFFFPPTVLVDARDDMRAVREEIFGPILATLPFTTEDEVVTRANATPFGLGAGVWTRDVGRAHRLGRRLRAGSVWVNCYNAIDPAMPSGGMKASGYGREYGRAHLDEHLETKSLWISSR